MSKGPPRQNRSPKKEGRRDANVPAPAEIQERTTKKPEPGTYPLVRPHLGTIRRILSRDRTAGNNTLPAPLWWPVPAFRKMQKR